MTLHPWVGGVLSQVRKLCQLQHKLKVTKGLRRNALKKNKSHVKGRQVIEDLLQGKQSRPELGESLPGHFPSQPVYQQHVKRIEIFNRHLEQRRDLCFCVGIPRT